MNAPGANSTSQWQHEPSKDAILNEAATALGLTQAEQGAARLTKLGEGVLSKAYLLSSPARGEFVMRVSLPVDPTHKTVSEVATMLEVASKTMIPLSQVVCYKATATVNNSIGHEWILMRFMPGMPLTKELWASLSLQSKTGIITELAEWTAQLFTVRHSKIGGLYQDPGRPMTIRRVASPNQYSQSTNRGPFSSTRQYLVSQFEELNKAAAFEVEQAEDGAERDRATRALQLIEWFSDEIQLMFPATTGANTVPEEFALFHDDMHGGNILVDNQRRASALLDWECLPVGPLYKAAGYPKILTDPEYEDAHREVLQTAFLETMEHHSSEWIDIFANDICRRLHNIDIAFQESDSDLVVTLITHWPSPARSQKEWVYEDMRRYLREG